jgi:hypothetical protein
MIMKSAHVGFKLPIYVYGVSGDRTSHSHHSHLTSRDLTTSKKFPRTKVYLGHSPPPRETFPSHTSSPQGGWHSAHFPESYEGRYRYPVIVKANAGRDA